MESRVKNVSRNIIYAFILQILKTLLIFASRIIFVKKLGAAYLGINGLFTNILGILSLTELGITTALMYSLYKPLSIHDEEKIAQYINYFRRIYNVIAMAILTVGIGLIPFLKYLVNLPDEMPHIYLYYVLLLLNSVISYLFVYKTTLLSADQKMYIINKYDMLFQVVQFVLQTLILFITNSFALYLISNIICTLLNNALKVRKAKQIYPYLQERKSAVLPKEERKKLFENVFSLFFYKLGGVIQSNTDNILISIFVGTIAVGYYSNYSTIILSITTFLTIIFTSLKASVGNYVSTKNKDEQYKMFNILETYNFWIVSFCAICFVILIPNFVSICFGDDYVLSFSILICAVLDFYTSNIRQTLWIYRETTGIFKKTRHITLVTSAINLVLSVILGHFYGLVGIIGATIISRFIYAWWKEPYIIYKDYFKMSPKKYYIDYIKRFILMIVICGLTYIVCNLIQVANIYIVFAMRISICLVIPTSCLLIIYRKSEATIYLKNSLCKILKKRGKII